MVSSDFLHLTPLHTIQGDGQWETEATIVGWKIRTTNTRQPTLYSNECPLSDSYVNEGFDLSDYLVAQTRKVPRLKYLILISNFIDYRP